MTDEPNTAEAGKGWVAWNPDTGEEYSPNHPIRSGECVEAERIRPSTPQEDVLWAALQVQFQRAEAVLASRPDDRPTSVGVETTGWAADGDATSLAECRPGPFAFGTTLGFKTEYGKMETVGPTDVPGDQIRWTVGRYPDAYCLDTGETFWGGAKDHDARAALIVQPVWLAAAPAMPVGGDREAIARALCDRRGWFWISLSDGQRAMFLADADAILATLRTAPSERAGDEQDAIDAADRAELAACLGRPLTARQAPDAEF